VLFLIAQSQESYWIGTNPYAVSWIKAALLYVAKSFQNWKTGKMLLRVQFSAIIRQCLMLKV